MTDNQEEIKLRSQLEQEEDEYESFKNIENQLNEHFKNARQVLKNYEEKETLDKKDGMILDEVHERIRGLEQSISDENLERKTNIRRLEDSIDEIVYEQRKEDENYEY